MKFVPPCETSSTTPSVVQMRQLATKRIVCSRCGTLRRVHKDCQSELRQNHTHEQSHTEIICKLRTPHTLTPSHINISLAIVLSDVAIVSYFAQTRQRVHLDVNKANINVYTVQIGNMYGWYNTPYTESRTTQAEQQRDSVDSTSSR